MSTLLPSQIVSYIDSKYPQALKDTPFYLTRGHAGPIAFLLRMVDALPSGVIALQGDALAEFGEAVEVMRVAMHAWNGGDNHYKCETLPGRGSSSPLTFVRKHLANCPDTSISPATADLAFMSDAPLRESLRLDISSANRSLSVGDWKGCTVVAGSIAEALLLWAVDHYETSTPGQVAAAAKALHPGTLTQRAPADLLRWSLHELTEVALALRIITDTTAAQCRIAKDFRNLIHPGRAARLSLRSTLGTSLSALAAVEHVIGDLAVHGIA